MSHPSQVPTARHRRTPPNRPGSRWLYLAVASVTVASLSTAPLLLVPNDIRVADVTLAAQSTSITRPLPPPIYAQLFAAVAAPHPASVPDPAPTVPEKPSARSTSDAESAAIVKAEKSPDTDVMKTGNKVEPTDVAGSTPAKPDAGSPEPAASATTTSDTRAGTED